MTLISANLSKICLINFERSTSSLVLSLVKTCFIVILALARPIYSGLKKPILFSFEGGGGGLIPLYTVSVNI